MNEDGEKQQRGLPSWRRICFICLDSKARLVLPLEIRDSLGIRPGEKILFSIGAATGSSVTVTVAKAPENAESLPYSRNGGYVKTGRRRKWQE